MNKEQASHNTPPAEEDRGERDFLVTAAMNAQLPANYQWGDDAMEAFNFGKTCAANAVEAALLSSPRVEGAWKPIETAPKDGTRIMVCGPAEDGSTYMDACAWPKGWSGLWPVAYMAYAAGDATHWRPLPDPPALSPQGE